MGKFAVICRAVSYLTCIIAVLTFAGAETGFHYNFKPIVGARLPGPGTSVAGPRSPVHCCMKCTSHGGCVAVNFNTGTKTCELLEHNDTLLPLEYSPDWKLYLDVNNTDPMLWATASQSSMGYGGTAQYAIDGITSPYWSDNNCVHTHVDDTSPWWQLELGISRGISGVILWNRIDGGWYYRLSNLTISVSSTLEGLDHVNHVCGTFPGPPALASDNPITVTCQQEMMGRYIKVHKNYPDFLNLCEVEVIWA